MEVLQNRGKPPRPPAPVVTSMGPSRTTHDRIVAVRKRDAACPDVGVRTGAGELGQEMWDEDDVTRIGMRGDEGRRGDAKGGGERRRVGKGRDRRLEGARTACMWEHLTSPCLRSYKVTHEGVWRHFVAVSIGS
jgi:hypothetical protein